MSSSYADHVVQQVDLVLNRLKQPLVDGPLAIVVLHNVRQVLMLQQTLLVVQPFVKVLELREDIIKVVGRVIPTYLL